MGREERRNRAARERAEKAKASAEAARRPGEFAANEPLRPVSNWKAQSDEAQRQVEAVRTLPLPDGMEQGIHDELVESPPRRVIIGGGKRRAMDLAVLLGVLGTVPGRRR
jgi:hypothetical protein